MALLKSYGAVVSLGGNCGAASQLRMRGLRPFSLPFDWIGMDEPKTIEWLCGALKTDFAGFCLRENLVELPRGGNGTAEYKYYDTLTGYKFIHHFHQSAETEEGYRATFSVFERRFVRFRRILDGDAPILFVLATNFEYPTSLGVKLLEALRARRPGAVSDLHLMQYGAKFENSLVQAQVWPADLPFTGGRYARLIDSYDFNCTDTDWRFLDGITLIGFPRKKFTGLNRIKYKLWKRFSKEFRDGGYGCAPLRFCSKTSADQEG